MYDTDTLTHILLFSHLLQEDQQIHLVQFLLDLQVLRVLQLVLYFQALPTYIHIMSIYDVALQLFLYNLHLVLSHPWHQEDQGDLQFPFLL